MKTAAHVLIQVSQPSSAISSSWYSSAIRLRIAASVTITSRWPWLKPALGVRWAIAAMRSSTSRGTGSSAKWRTIRRRLTTSLNSMAAPLPAVDAPRGDHG